MRNTCSEATAAHDRRWEQLHAAAPAPAPPEQPREAEEREEQYLDGDPFQDDDDEERAIAAAKSMAQPCLDKLRSQLGAIQHCAYPNGTVTVTTEADEDVGLALDPSPAAAEAFTVHREFGDGEFDVVMFEGQPRTTLVCFPASAERTDIAVGLRGRALLQQDIAWCERDLYDEDEDDPQHQIYRW